MLGGLIGGILGIVASVAVTRLCVLVYSDDPSASSIGGVLPIIFLPLGIIIGIVRGSKKKDEEA